MSNILRALVVDDDPIARKTVMFALEYEDFSCDLAVDGDDALRQIRDNAYDLVVTDLQMPNKHGHALSIELLELNPRPLIVVHSSVDDPRLAKDLMMRGVDDIIYKPTNYAAFAAKVKGLVCHRQTRGSNIQPLQQESTSGFSVTEKKNVSEPEQPLLDKTQATSDGLFVPIADIESKISLVSRVLPVSKTALDVFTMTRSECDATKLGAAIQRDAALAAEVLAISNSSFYNPSGNPITQLDRAVVRIGQQRIGELALSAATLSALTERKLPWMDMQTIWRQSIAAGVAVEHLVDQGRHGKTGDSLVLVAIMNSLGRVVLGTLYPNHYCQLIKQCVERDEALIEQEKQVFPENHARTMTRLLSVWKLPDEICKPMNYLLDSYASLSRLPEPTRTKVELIKLAVFIGQLATKAWHSWDQVEIPPASLLRRLRIHDIKLILEQTQADAQAIMNFKIGSSPAEEEASASLPSESAGTIFYENISTLPFDFIAQIMRDLEVEADSISVGDAVPRQKVVINSLGLSKDCQPSALTVPGGANMLVITDSDNPPDFDTTCEILRIPASYSKIRSTLLSVATNRSTIEQPAVVASYDVRI